MTVDSISFILYLIGGLLLFTLIYLIINDIVEEIKWRKEYGSD